LPTYLDPDFNKLNSFSQLNVSLQIYDSFMVANRLSVAILILAYTLFKYTIISKSEIIIAS